MADYSNYGKRRFWCEICNTSMPYTKQAIQDHERSQKHKKQADRHLQDEQRKNRKAKNSEKPLIQKLANGYTANELQELKAQFEPNPHQEKEKLNISKFYASKGFSEAKMDVIDQQKKVDLQEQNKNNPFYDVWRLQRDQETGKLCFYNTLSRVKQFEKPFGLKLAQHEQRL